MSNSNQILAVAQLPPIPINPQTIDATPQSLNQFNIDPDLVGTICVSISIKIAEPDSELSFIGSAISNPLGLRIQKSVRGIDSFVLDFAPSELNALVNGVIQTPGYAPNSLISMITPMSTIAITLSRGNQEYPVFFGVITNIQESFRRTKEKVIRTVEISGVDLQFFLTNYAYYTLTWLGTPNALTQVLGGIAGFKQIQNGQFVGSPQGLASQFYNQTTSPYLSKTSLNTNIGFVPVSELISNCFGPFTTTSAIDATLVFPFLSNFYVSDGTWWEKYMTFFPPPLYESFFTTINVSSPLLNSPSLLNTGNPDPFNLKSVTVKGAFGTDYDVTNAFIARMMPFPQLRTGTVILSKATPLINTPSLYVDMSSWNALGEYIFQTTNPILESTIEFKADDARSFYAINPQQMTNMFGGNGANGLSTIYLLTGVGAIIDPINLAKYGYRPEMAQVEWLSVNRGEGTVTNTDEIFTLLTANMLLTLASYWVPLPLMASGKIKIPLSPYVLPGNKITCQPFKDTDPWTFYIDEVEHIYTFGQESFTMIGVSRGLPTVIYNDTHTMFQLLCGTMERAGLQYQSINIQNTSTGYIGIGLVTLDNIQQLFSNIAGGSFTIPQGQ